MLDSNDRLQQIMKLLADEVRERLERHPLGHLVAGRGDRLDVRLAVPTALREGTLDRAAVGAEESVQSAIQSLVAHSARFQPGRVFCLRCQSASCEHSAPTGNRQVFTGYGGTGVPRFADMAQWLLQRRDPRIDLLYREPPQLVATVTSGDEMTSELLPAFLQQESGYRLHGQVAVGWYPAPDPKLPGRQPLAVSFQVISSRARGGRRRFGLNVIGIGPGGEPLEHLYDRMGRVGEIPPWGGSVRWAQTVLGSIEHQLDRAPRTPPKAVDQRIEGLVNALARRLEKGWRGEERRTQHAKVRHREGDRPTRMALADFARATPEDLLFDTRRDTLVVVGDRGRAHVFSREGKLVTSIRYNPAVIEKRRQNGMWRPAAKEEVEAISTLLSAAGRD
ncbi:MAG TPA: hypothetical protein VNM67_14885 [Thermoanaerobaculia bacterium]|jgi:hypothetical protein|nr:hypothetical protein [Thermoanaerobaculia bacterium]